MEIITCASKRFVHFDVTGLSLCFCSVGHTYMHFYHINIFFNECDCMFYLTQKSTKNLPLISLKIQVQKSYSNYTFKFNEQVIYTQEIIVLWYMTWELSACLVIFAWFS